MLVTSAKSCGPVTISLVKNHDQVYKNPAEQQPQIDRQKPSLSPIDVADGHEVIRFPLHIQAWKLVDYKKFKKEEQQELTIYAPSLERQVQIRVPPSCSLLQVKQQALSALKLALSPSEVLLHKQLNEVKEDTPSPLQGDTHELFLHIISPSSNLLSYEVDPERPLDEGLHPGFDWPIMDCKLIYLLDTNMILHHMTDEKFRQSISSPGALAGFTYTVKSELIHPSAGKEPQNISALVGRFDLQYLKTDEFAQDRLDMMWNTLYPVIWYKTMCKSTGTPFPRKWASWRDGDEYNAMNHARNDMSIWLEAFAVARSRGKPVVLHTADADFLRFKRSKPEIERALLSSWDRETLKMVTIKYHKDGSSIDVV